MNTDLAFPTPDDAVRDYLVKTSISLDLKTNYLKFLGSVFKRVCDELEKCRKEWGGKRTTTAQALAEWWSKHLESVRTELYKAAIDGAGEDIEVCIREDGKRYHQSLVS